MPYVDPAMTKAERRLCLSQRYFFDFGPGVSLVWHATLSPCLSINSTSQASAVHGLRDCATVYSCLPCMCMAM